MIKIGTVSNFKHPTVIATPMNIGGSNLVSYEMATLPAVARNDNFKNLIPPLKIAYFDCFSGISGDMILGALIDAGLPLVKLQRELKKLPLSGYRLKKRRVNRHGIIGTKVDVIIKSEQHLPFNRMLRIIQKSRLDNSVKKTSLHILNRLGAAEAKVHGFKTLEDVHFHELGSLDTIIDIVGSVTGLHLLGVVKIYAGALPLTSGTIRCAHGELPVPGPATMELIRKWPLFYLNQTEELVTPTGAAILTTLAQPVPDNQMPVNSAPLITGFTANKIGYGAGRKKLINRPNLLRLIIGETSETFNHSGEVTGTDRVWVLETNLDDVSPQALGYLLEKILDEEALDVFVTPIQMKKSRPGFLLSVITTEEKISRTESLIFSETGTLGIRRHPVWRTKLKRVFKKVRTKYGVVSVKIGFAGNEIKSISPEYEDCRKIAQRKNIPLKEIMTEVIKQEKR